MNIDLKDIKEKAKKLITLAEPHAIRQTAGYDAAKNKIFVAGYQLDGVVNATVSADTITKYEGGIDYYYTTYYEVLTQRSLTVTLLPTAECLQVIRLLALKQLDSKGWFNISVHENDKLVNVYRGWIVELPEISMQLEAGDRQVTFGIKPMFSGVSVIDEPTDTEKTSYSRYGSRPDRYNNGGFINETDGGLEDIPYQDLPLDVLPPQDGEGIVPPNNGFDDEVL